MRKAVIGASALLLVAGCGEQPANNGASNTVSGSVSDPSSNTDARAAEAAAFLRSRLNKLDLTQGSVKAGMGSYSWEIADLRLQDNQWSWTEHYTQNSVDQSGAVFKRNDETYRLDPSKLNYPTAVQENVFNGNTVWSVKIECASADCITVSGTKTTAIALAYGQSEPETKEAINDQTEQNSWQFRDKETAERASRAIDALIAHAGGSRRSF